MSIEIKRQQNGAPVKDIALSMNLLKDNIVSGSSSIRPELWEEIKVCVETMLCNLPIGTYSHVVT